MEVTGPPVNGIAVNYGYATDGPQFTSPCRNRCSQEAGKVGIVFGKVAREPARHLYALRHERRRSHPHQLLPHPGRRRPADRGRWTLHIHRATSVFMTRRSTVWVGRRRQVMAAPAPISRARAAAGWTTTVTCRGRGASSLVHEPAFRSRRPRPMVRVSARTSSLRTRHGARRCSARWAHCRSTATASGLTRTATWPSWKRRSPTTAWNSPA